MAQPGWVNLNGEVLPAAEARIGLFDHGLLYGDGLFETLRVYGGRFFRLAAHLERLRTGAAVLKLRLPWSDEELAEAVRATVRANSIADGVVRLTVTRGEGPPVPDPALCPAPAYFVTVRPGAPPLDVEGGIHVCAAGAHPWPRKPGVKALSYLPFLRARQDAARLGCGEGLLLDGDLVVEACASNVFAVAEGVVWTPDLAGGCLPGVTRAAVLELSAAGGLPCREAPLPLEALHEAGEVFLTNSGIQVQAVASVDGVPVGSGAPGPTTRLLRERYRRLVEREASP